MEETKTVRKEGSEGGKEEGRGRTKEGREVGREVGRDEAGEDAPFRHTIFFPHVEDMIST